MSEMMRSGPNLLWIHKGFCRLLVALENIGLIHGVLQGKLLSKNKTSSEILGVYKQVLMENCRRNFHKKRYGDAERIAELLCRSGLAENFGVEIRVKSLMAVNQCIDAYAAWIQSERQRRIVLPSQLLLRLHAGVKEEWRLLGLDGAIASIKRLVTINPEKFSLYLFSIDFLLDNGCCDEALDLVNRQIDIWRLGEASYAQKQKVLDAMYRLGSPSSVVCADPEALAFLSLAGEYVTQDQILEFRSRGPTSPLYTKTLNARITAPNDEKYRNEIYVARSALMFGDVFGVFDCCGHPFEKAYARQKDKYRSRFPLNAKWFCSDRKEDLKCIDVGFYIGYNHGHFGHRLTELVSAIYPLLVWRSVHKETIGMHVVVHHLLSSPVQLERLYALLHRLLGIQEDQFIVVGKTCRNLSVDRLCFSAPSCDLKFLKPFSSQHPYYVRQYVRLLSASDADQAGTVSIQPSRKVFISKTKVSRRSAAFEASLEHKLKKAGWLIFHPEDYSVRVQALVYERSELVCSRLGSALHFLMGLSSQSCPKIIALNDSPPLVDRYRYQFELQAVEFRIIDTRGLSRALLFDAISEHAKTML